jgi:protein-tyrosine-phosphatase
MASAMFRQIVDQNSGDLEWRVESAGTWGVENIPAAQGAQSVMQTRGLDLSEHRSRIVSASILQETDLILTMERGHKESLAIEFPEHRPRIFMLSELIGQTFDIPDPIGGPLSGYEQTAQDIEQILVQGSDTIMRFLTQGLM